MLKIKSQSLVHPCYIDEIFNDKRSNPFIPFTSDNLMPKGNHTCPKMLMRSRTYFLILPHFNPTARIRLSHVSIYFYNITQFPISIQSELLLTAVEEFYTFRKKTKTLYKTVLRHSKTST